MPGKTDISKLNCSLARALSAVGDWWTLLIVRDAFLGATRFGQFQASLGIARNILSARLAALVEDGIMARDASRARPEYRLTRKGREMLPALIALLQWGDKWQSGGRAPVLCTDTHGRTLAPVRLTNRSGAAIDADTIRFRAGPGATRATRAYLDAVRPQKHD